MLIPMTIVLSPSDLLPHNEVVGLPEQDPEIPTPQPPMPGPPAPGDPIGNPPSPGDPAPQPPLPGGPGPMNPDLEQESVVY